MQSLGTPQNSLKKKQLLEAIIILNYLEQNCSVKKKKDTYTLKYSDKTKLTCSSFYLDMNENESIEPKIEVLEVKQLQLLTFLYSALENGWNIKKHATDYNKYVFSKKHNLQHEVYQDDYLTNFIKKNLRL